MEERAPLGVERTPSAAGRPVSKTGIMILILIIILACIFIYYYSPKLYEGEKEKKKTTATFNDFYEISAIDSDNDGHYDYLNIGIGVNVSEYGKYSVDGDLHVGSNVLYSSNTAYLCAGNQTITLSFNGLKIYLSRVNGSYALRNLTLRIIEGNTSIKMDYEDYAYDTPLYNYTNFQSRYHAEYDDLITGSSPQVNATSKECSFDVKETAVWINITVNFVVQQAGIIPKDSDIDLYLYYEGKNDSVASSTNRGNEPESISLNKEYIASIGYGKWIALVHHYSNIPTTNTATYTLTIEVTYD